MLAKSIRRFLLLPILIIRFSQRVAKNTETGCFSLCGQASGFLTILYGIIIA